MIESAAASPVEQISFPRTRRWRVRGTATLSVYLAVVVLFVVAGVFAPWISPADPGQQSLRDRLHPPAWQEGGTWDHLLGTDELGRDTLSRLIHGTRVSLIVVVASIPAAMVIGTALGLTSGWLLGWTDRALMRAVDIQLALPPILLAVLLAAIFGASLRNVILILVIFRWAGYARLVRAETISLSHREFVIAARTIGAGNLRIMLRHILPNVLNSIVILATLDIAVVIIAEASLSFLGVGVPAGTLSWGSMIAEGRNLLSIAWWLVTVPGIAILLVALVGNLLGDWLRDALDPQLRHSA